MIERPSPDWTRRRFLALVGSSAGAGALAIACGRDDGQPSAAPAAAPSGLRGAPASEAPPPR